MIDKSIIKIAFDTKNYGLRNITKNISTYKNKICGDEITVELVIKKKEIKKMYYETQSCIFCQASASLLSRIATKNNIEEWSLIIKEINKNKGISSLKDDKLKIFNKLFLKKYNNRFSCVMLPFNALVKTAKNTL
jgi:nitrogen fixation protein NifU and related proteins